MDNWKQGEAIGRREGELDEAVARALEAVDPPTGFADRVLARVEQDGTPAAVLRWSSRRHAPRHPALFRPSRFGAWAAALALGCGLAEGGHVWVEQRRAQERQAQAQQARQAQQAQQVQQGQGSQEQQAEVAEQQFDRALRVTDRTLAKTRERLRRAGVRLTD